MAIELASAYVSILPSAKGFSSALDKELSGVGRHAGTRFSDDMAGEVDRSTKSGAMSKAFKGIAIAAGGAFAVVGAARVFGGFIKEAEEAAKIGRQTEAVLKSTGGVANVSARDVDKLADALSRKAGVDDELIAGGANVLLTFTKVRNEAGKGNDIFNRGAEAALNMSSALGTDLQGSVLQIGKALNDPVKGMTALTRAGVSFTEQQKDQVKAMVAAGDTLGAQKLILAEMDVQFGGAAAASATASQKLSVAWGNIQEQIGEKLLPIFATAAEWLSKMLPVALDKVGDAFGWFRDNVLDKVVMGFRALIDSFKVGDVTSDGWVGVLERIGSTARDIYDKVVPAIGTAFEWLKDEVLPAIGDAFGWIADNIIPKVGDALAWVADEVIPKIVAGAKEVAKWIGANWRAIFEKAGEVIADVAAVLFDFGKWIVENQPVLIGLGVAIGTILVGAFISWAASATAAAVATLAAAAPFIAIGVAITAVVAALVYAYQEWEWFRKAVDATVDWITGTLVPVLKTVGEAIVTGIAAAVEWVTETAIPALVDAFHFVEGVVKAVWPTVETIIKVAMEAVRTYIEVGIAIIKTVWESLDEIYWFLKNFVIDPILTYVDIWWTVFTTAVKVGIATVITAFKVILEIVDWLNRWVIEPIKSAIDVFFNAAGGVVSLIEDGIGLAIDAFHKIEEIVQWAHDHIYKPVAQKFNEVKDAIVGAFERAKEVVGQVWEGIKNTVKDPINVVIGFVNGLGGGINSILNWILPGNPNLIPGIPKLATGGWVPGTGNRDTVPAMLTPGEYVIPKEAAAAWDEGTLELVRRGPTGTVDPGVFGYAAGGYVRSPEEALAWSRQHDNKRYQFPMVGPSTFDCSGFMGAIWNFIMGRPPYRRVFSTGSFGGSGYRNFGFEKGYDPSGFSVGVRLPYTRNAQGATVGHMAGTLAGTQVEAGGRGVQVGPPAQGATPGFPLVFTLPGYGSGTFAGGGGLPRDGIYAAVDAAIKGGGFTGSDLIRMVAIAGGESGYNPNVHTVDSDDDSWGLWQINRRAWDIKGLGFQRWEEMFDPTKNAQAARHIYDRQGYRAWGAFTNGSYQRYMDDAGMAVAAYQAGGGFGPTTEEQSIIAKMKDIAGSVLGDLGAVADGGFGKMLKGMVEELPKKIFNKLIVELPGRFVNWVKDAVGQVAGLVFPDLGGGAWSPSSWLRFAEGGIIKARPGGTAIQGTFAENGHDEAVIPLPNGWQGMGGVTVNLVVEGNIYGDRAFDEKVDKKLNDVGRQVLALAGRS